jgi:hypothetical protein
MKQTAHFCLSYGTFLIPVEFAAILEHITAVDESYDGTAARYIYTPRKDKGLNFKLIPKEDIVAMIVTEKLT